MEPLQKKILTLNREQTRNLDRQAVENFGVPDIILMENAGRSMADFILAKNLSGSVLVICGKGNNGGDGMVIARHLDNHRIPVTLAMCADSDMLQGSARINYIIAKKSGIEIIPVSDKQKDIFEKKLDSADWTVDAIFGTGFQGKLDDFYSDIIELINARAKKILAVDIPSGLDCDQGVPSDATIKADVTLTVAAMKAGFLQSGAKRFTGEIHVIEAGFPRRLLQSIFHIL
jgi:NAD(P)H-hydrate epimerase